MPSTNRIIEAKAPSVGPTSLEAAEEYAEVTGRQRVRIVSTNVAPRFAELSVRGRIEVQAELDPWMMYQGTQTYQRSVESLFTRGLITREIHFTDPPGKGGAPEQPADGSENAGFQANPPPRRTRGKFWAAAPEQPTPRARVSWRLYDTLDSDGRVTLGDTLGWGAVASMDTGDFEIVLSSTLVREAARTLGEEKHLHLTVEGGLTPVVLTISRDTLVRISRELEG